MTKSAENSSEKENLMLGNCPRCNAQIFRSSSSCPHCKAEFTDEEKEELTRGLPSTQTSCIVLLGLAAAFGSFIYIIVTNIGSGSGYRSYEADKLVIEWAAKDRVRAALRDPESARFSGIIAKPLPEEGKGIVCGRVQSRNGFGGMSLPQRFVVTDKVFLIEEQASPEEMGLYWDMFCKPV